jgi:nitrogen regulatory protein P-II 1
MKKLEIVIKSEKLEKVKKALDDQGATGAMITNIMGYGNQKGYKTKYRGSEYVVNLLPKIKVETVVEDDKVENLIQTLSEILASEHVGAGKIFIYNVEDAVRIRTGERGDVAL